MPLVSGDYTFDHAWRFPPLIDYDETACTPP